MEKLVLVKSNNYKRALIIFAAFILFVLVMIIKDSFFSGKPIKIDLGTYILGTGVAFLVWAGFALRMVLFAYPRSITKLPDGFYEVKTVLFKFLVHQSELVFRQSKLKKGLSYYDLFFDYVAVPFTFLSGRPRFVFERDVPMPMEDEGLTIVDTFNIMDNGKMAFIIGRDYVYEGDGNPLDFFKDNRPPERKKLPEPPPVEVPPELDNPYGIKLPDE